MARKNRIRVVSLLAATSGFTTMGLLRHFQLLGPHAGWSILQAGFEAGMVGGCADWFAVSELFHPILGLPHTNIIVRNRAKLSAGVEHG